VWEKIGHHNILNKVQLHASRKQQEYSVAMEYLDEAQTKEFLPDLHAGNYDFQHNTMVQGLRSIKRITPGNSISFTVR
jgi:hypothetical protein